MEDTKITQTSGLDINQLHIGQLVQIKETKEIAKVIVIDGYFNSVEVIPSFKRHPIEDCQLPSEEGKAFWLVETHTNTTTAEYGFYSNDKIPILDVREFAARKIKDDETISKIDIINAFGDINYIVREAALCSEGLKLKSNSYEPN